MTLITPLGRALSQQFLPRTYNVLTRLSASTGLRAPYTTPSSNPAEHPRPLTGTQKFSSCFKRNLATATTTKPAGRPKAHTGKSTASKTTSKAKKAPAKASKTKKKARAVKKPKVKAKPKPKRKAPSASAIKRKAAAQRKSLKTRALLTEPKQLPDNAWTVYFVGQTKGVHSGGVARAQNTRTIAANYKELSPLERERLNHTANENKSTNERNYKQWVSQFTPLEVKEANVARRALAIQKKAASKSGKAYIPQIRDVRIVKRPRNAYSYYVTQRYSSGDFKNMLLKESAGLISGEWKALSSSQKQPFIDQAKQDKSRYLDEHKTVYGQDAGQTGKRPKQT